MQDNHKKNLLTFLFSLLFGSGILWATYYIVAQINTRNPLLNVIQFKMRYLPLAQDGKCRRVRSLFSLGSEIKIDAEILEKINFQSPYSYRVEQIVLAPGGYIIAEIYESRTSYSPDIALLHTIIYKKNKEGKYSQLEDCQKGLI